MSAPETDLRQGVTPIQHEVLDLIEQRSREWRDLANLHRRLEFANLRARSALRCTALIDKQIYAIEAAARLIDAAEEIGRMITEIS